MAPKVQIAKKDLFAEIDDGSGHKIRRLIARKGQEVPPGVADLVDDADVSSGTAKTRSLLGRSSIEQLAGAEVVEPDHSDARAAAAIAEPQADDEPADLPGDEEQSVQEDPKQKKARKKAADKAQKDAPNKARPGAKSK